MKIPKNMERAMAEYLRRHYPQEQVRIAKRAQALYPAMAAKAPDIGDKRNPMADNLYMMIAFLAYYEASEHSIGAEANGYMDLLPVMCKTDHITARMLHAKLIRTHTVAQGCESCDDWYVGDESETAKQYAELPLL